MTSPRPLSDSVMVLGRFASGFQITTLEFVHPVEVVPPSGVVRLRLAVG